MLAPVILVALLTNEVSSKIDALAADALNQGAQGLAIGVVQNGKLTFSKGYSKHGNIDATSEFRIGSVTKQFTATLIVRLMTEKKLSLEDTLGKWVPETPNSWHEITIRQLLTHTSGIPNYTENPLFGFLSSSDTTTEKIWKSATTQKPTFEPGKGWHYSNTGYVLLGIIAEKAGHAPYYSQLSTKFFKPLRMTRTGQESEFPVVPSFDSEGKPSAKISMTWPFSAGAIVSNITDLAKWDAALRGSKILTKAEKDLLFTPDSVAIKFGEHYAFGWHGVMEGERQIGVDHSGGIPGFSTFFKRSFLKGTSVIVLNNSEYEKTGAVANKVLALHEPNFEIAPLPVVVDTQPKLTESHRILFESILDGSFDVARFDSSFLKQVSPDQLRTGATKLAAMGKLEQFLFSSEKKEAVVTRVYAVKLGETNLKLTITENASGKIIGMLIG